MNSDMYEICTKNFVQVKIFNINTITILKQTIICQFFLYQANNGDVVYDYI